MTEKSQIYIKLQGFKCNGYPKCKVNFNNKEILNCEIIDVFEINQEVVFIENNILTIEHYGKKFGENNVYDTILQDGKIIEDKYIIVKDIVISGVSLKPWWHLGEFTEQNLHLNQESFGLYKNSVYSYNFTSPFYEFLILQKRKGYKEIGPLYALQELNSEQEEYSLSQLQFNELIEKAKNLLNAAN